MRVLRVALCGCGVSLALAAAAASAPGDPFTGGWKATDGFDGSSLTLAISAPQANGVRHVAYFDQNATGAFCFPGKPAMLNGDGSATADTLTATVTFRCGDFVLTGLPLVLTANGGTITDEAGNVFRRAGD